MALPTILRSLFDYNHWVNGLLLDVAEAVPAERTREAFGGSFDTIHGTFTHILQAELHYYSRWSGEALATEGRPADLGSIQDLRAWRLAHRDRVDAFLEGLQIGRASCRERV